jgi:uncharacterized membrane protein
MTAVRPRLAEVGAALIVSTLIVAPFFVSRGGTGVPPTHDMAQHLSVSMQFDAALRSGVMYPRWQHAFNGGYGLPWLNYYPPGFYFLAEGFYLVIGHWTRALLALFVLLTASSGLAFYHLARRFFVSPAAALGALLYLVTPYRTVDLYWRGALPELAGFLFVPLIMLFAHRAGTTGARRDVALLGLLHGLYLFTHFPVAYLFTYVLAVYALVWAAAARNARIALRIGSGVALAMLVSAAYWLPAFMERPFVREPFSHIFPYHDSYITLRGGGDVFNATIDRTFITVSLALVAALVVLLVVRRRDLQTRLLSAMAIVTLLMVTPYSEFIGRLIPGIDAISFAWRWLLIVSCFFALVWTAAADAALQRRSRSAFAALVVVLAVHVMTTAAMIPPAFGNETLVAPLERKESGFVPAGASDPDALPDTEQVVVMPPAEVEVARWDPLRREVIVRANGESRVRLRTLAFPGWRARVDGARTPIEQDSTGAQIIRVSGGAHRIAVTFGSTPVRSGAVVLSMLGVVLVAGAAMFRAPRAAA